MKKKHQITLFKTTTFQKMTYLAKRVKDASGGMQTNDKKAHPALMIFPGKRSWVVLPVAPGQASGKHAGSVNQLIGFISLKLKLESSFFFFSITISAREEATF